MMWLLACVRALWPHLLQGVVRAVTVVLRPIRRSRACQRASARARSGA